MPGAGVMCLRQDSRCYSFREYMCNAEGRGNGVKPVDGRFKKNKE